MKLNLEIPDLVRAQKKNDSNQFKSYLHCAIHYCYFTMLTMPFTMLTLLCLCFWLVVFFCFLGPCLLCIRNIFGSDSSSIRHFERSKITVNPMLTHSDQRSPSNAASKSEQLPRRLSSI